MTHFPASTNRNNRAGLWLAACLFGCWLAAPAVAQEPDSAAEASADQVVLEPIPVADLAPLEAGVRTVIEDRQQMLAALLDSGPDRPTAAGAFGEMGFLYHAHELWPQALASYRNALTIDPRDPRWSYAAAVAEQSRGELDVAAAWLDRCLDLLPENATALVRLAEIRLSQNQLGEAKALLRHALTVSAESPAALAALGQLSMQADKPREAIDFFQRALSQVPEATRLHYPLGLAYRALGDLEKAKEHLALRGEVGVRPFDPVLDAIEERKAGSRVYILDGRRAFAAGRYEEALVFFEKALAAEPESLPARVNLATARAMTGDQAAALAEFDAILAIEPENAAAHYNLGVMRARDGDLESARGHLERAVASDAADPEARSWLGRVLAAAGDREAAVGHLDASVDMRPGDAETWLLLSRVLADLGRHREVREKLEEAHRLMPEHGVVLHELARRLATSPDLEQRRGELAVNLASKVVGAAATPEHLLTLAASLGETGRCADASQVIAQMLEQIESLSEEDRTALSQLRDGYAAGPPCRP